MTNPERRRKWGHRVRFFRNWCRKLQFAKASVCVSIASPGDHWKPLLQIGIVNIGSFFQHNVLLALPLKLENCKTILFFVNSFWSGSFLIKFSSVSARTKIEELTAGSDSGNPGNLAVEKELTAWWKSKIHTQFPLWLRMVQDSITDHFDTAQENSSHLNFTYRMAIIFAEIAPRYVTYPRF